MAKSIKKTASAKNARSKKADSKPRSTDTPARRQSAAIRGRSEKSDKSDKETSLADEAYHKILLRIIRGELPGGSVLKCAQLAREIGISRTPVARALDRLRTDGIVTHEMNKRAVVREGAENWLVQIHELRELLEPPATALAAENMTPLAISKLEAIAESIPRKKGEAWIKAVRELDYGLHIAIAEHIANLPLRETLLKCWSFKRLSYEAGEDSQEVLRAGYQQHLAILEALKNRDGQTAAAAMQYHLRSAASRRTQQRIV